jgi:hypothetical protein
MLLIETKPLLQSFVLTDEWKLQLDSVGRID